MTTNINKTAVRKRFLFPESNLKRFWRPPRDMYDASRGLRSKWLRLCFAPTHFVFLIRGPSLASYQHSTGPTRHWPEMFGFGQVPETTRERQNPIHPFLARVSPFPVARPHSLYREQQRIQRSEGFCTENVLMQSRSNQNYLKPSKDKDNILNSRRASWVRTTSRNKKSVSRRKTQEGNSTLGPLVPHATIINCQPAFH